MQIRVIRVAVVLLFVCISPSFAEQLQDQCLNCHTDIGSPEAEVFKQDVHYKAGLSCSGCHGGDETSAEMEIAMSEAKGYVGVPKPENIPGVCAGCHSSFASSKQ